MRLTAFDITNGKLQWFDKTNTPNPRGKKYKDPGCRGFLEYQKNKRVFFDLSEDTAMPYRFIVKSRNIEFFIDFCDKV